MNLIIILTKQSQPHVLIPNTNTQIHTLLTAVKQANKYYQLANSNLLADLAAPLVKYLSLGHGFRHQLKKLKHQLTGFLL